MSNKNKIAICIKKKTFNSSKKTFNSSKKTSSRVSSAMLDTTKVTTDATAPSHTQKKHEVDMEKWPQHLSRILMKSVMMRRIYLVKQYLQASGKPICLICKRKFASIEKLRQH